MRAGLARTAEDARGAPGQTVVQHLFVPVFLLLSLWPWWSGAHGPQTATSLAARMSFAVAAAMLFTWLVEQLYPERGDWNVRLFSDGQKGLARLGRDLIYLVGLTWATARLLDGVDPWLQAFAHRLGSGVGAAHSLWPAGAPFAVRVGLAFLAIEFFSYWIHRAAHGSRLLWQFHSTHHGVTELNAFKAVRTHPLDNLVFHVGRLAPLLLAGAGAAELAAAVYFGALLGILAHANVRLSGGRFLALLVNLPRVHAVHHSARMAESQSNFGCHTVLWDRVFGTFRDPAPGDARIGIEPVGPRSLWQELAWPLYCWVSPGEQSANRK